ncbi:MAG TPA: hypothetical protein VHP33_35685 [Polyangiaceae bacterium]|nr:hypothetical protein [Polyangiaceae bacterium]
MKHRAAETSLELEEGVASDPSLRVSGVQARAARAESAPPLSLGAAALPLVSIGSPADPALLEPTYAYLSAYTGLCFSPRVAERLNVAIYELYANALRYGAPGGEVRLELERRGGGAALRVSNQAERAQLERLKTQLAQVQADAGAAFAIEMNRFAGGSQPPPMLGLVRVSHEAGLQLELSQSGERVEVSLVCEG